jgi:hypothetical protein
MRHLKDRQKEVSLFLLIVISLINMDNFSEAIPRSESFRGLDWTRTVHVVTRLIRFR